MGEQKIFFAAEDLICHVKKFSPRNIFLVHGRTFNRLSLAQIFNDFQTTHFTDFKPNPLFESVEAGIKVFGENNCDMIIAVGGGSAIDVAKCIKLYAAQNVPFIVVPTTAGTGSEATRFAVIYKNGEKQSIHDLCIIPDAIYFDAEPLGILPPYQRKATLLDAYSHAAESYWSVKATEESRAFAKEALRVIVSLQEKYFVGKTSDAENLLLLYAAYLAGKAINISETTAGHAMGYKLTSLFGISHGHAAALCNAGLWQFMQSSDAVKELSEVIGEKTFRELLIAGELIYPLKDSSDADFDSMLELLTGSVNPVRLKNFPVPLPENIIRKIYRAILLGEVQ
jgi:alcohol dehydrogenase class IV